ncbi:MAG: hypothetical protein IKP28_04745 [Clostridia bacterium]|nr:hypothetical protein [Clostridia bacterium]
MINVLIIENDPIVCKRIVNGILQNVKNVHLCGISYTVKEAIEIAKKQKVDLAILDCDLKNNVSLKFLDFASEYNKTSGKMSVIAMTNNIGNKELDYSCILKVINKPVILEQIINAIREFSNGENVSTQNILKNKILKELEKLQYNFSYVGTQYMAEAIYEIYTKKYIYSGGNLNKNIYPIIAEKHNTTVNNVKCNITSATKTMSEKCPKEIIQSYLFCDENEKPKVKEIMYKVINRL